MQVQTTTSAPLAQTKRPLLAVVASAETAPANDTPLGHAHYVALGYDVHGIIPHDAEISENAKSLIKKVGTSNDPRGKVPGRRNRAGKYGSWNWRSERPSKDDLAASEANGDGVGLLLGPQADGTHLVFIDADTLNADNAKVVKDEVDARFARPRVRVGRWPKAGYLVRLGGPMKYASADFDGGQVEILADGQQFVAEGIHPKTGKPYSWPRGHLQPLSDLPIFDPADVMAFLGALKGQLPSVVVSSLDGVGDADTDSTSPAAQAALRCSDVQWMRRLIQVLPNTATHFPKRRDLLRVMIAVKAALPDNPDEALEMAQQFAAGYVADDGDINDPDEIEDIWKTLRGPFRCGFRWLVNKLVSVNGGAGTVEADRAKGLIYFEEITPEWLADEAERIERHKLEPRTETEFDIAARIKAEQERAAEAEDRKKERETAVAVNATINWMSPDEWEGKAPPEREWEVPGLIPRHEVTLLYGDGGIGKTLIIHQYASAAAAGLPWLGQPTRKAKVMCFFCEDSEDELHRRQIDINAKLGVTHADLAANLRIASRKYMDNLLVIWDRNTGAMKRQAVWERLRDDAVAFGADVVILDTIADTYSGNEIDRAQVNAFVKSCLGRLAHEIGGTVIALGHPSVSGKASGSGTSGSTAWSNAVRSRLYLRYPKGVEKGNIRELEGMKLNYGPKGNMLKLRWNRGAFDVIASTIQGADDDVAGKAQSGFATIEDACDAAVFDAVAAAPDAVLALKANSPNYAPRILKLREPDLLLPYGPAEIEAALLRLTASGALVETQVGKDRARRPQMGFTANPAKMPLPPQEASEADARTDQADMPSSSDGVFE